MIDENWNSFHEQRHHFHGRRRANRFEICLKSNEGQKRPSIRTQRVESFEKKIRVTQIKVLVEILTLI